MPRERSAGVRNAIGWGGAKIFGGIVLDEYNPDLKGRLALQVADKMRRTTGQVRPLEQVIRLPIESTRWIVGGSHGAVTGRVDAGVECAGAGAVLAAR